MWPRWSANWKHCCSSGLIERSHRRKPVSGCTITPQSLAQQRLFLREAGSGSRHCVEAALRAKGVAIEALNVTMEVNSNDSIRAAVEQNAGIAFLSATTVANDLERGRLVRVGVKGVKPVRELFIVTPSGGAASRAVREFIEFVIAAQAD